MFQNFLLLAYFDKYLNEYPIKKKNINEATDAPIPNKILSFVKKFFEKFPRKKTVSE
jgi:hypothetical protein